MVPASYGGVSRCVSTAPGEVGGTGRSRDAVGVVIAASAVASAEAAPSLPAKTAAQLLAAVAAAAASRSAR